MPRQGSASDESLCDLPMPLVPAPTSVPPDPPDPPEPPVGAEPSSSSSESLHETRANDASSAAIDTFAAVREGSCFERAMTLHLVRLRHAPRGRAPVCLRASDRLE